VKASSNSGFDDGAALLPPVPALVVVEATGPAVPEVEGKTSGDELVVKLA